MAYYLNSLKSVVPWRKNIHRTFKSQRLVFMTCPGKRPREPFHTCIEIRRPFNFCLRVVWPPVHRYPFCGTWVLKGRRHVPHHIGFVLADRCELGVEHYWDLGDPVRRSDGKLFSGKFLVPFETEILRWNEAGSMGSR